MPIISIATEEEFEHFVLFLFEDRVKIRVDQYTIESAAVCARQLMSAGSLTVTAAVRIIHHLLYNNIIGLSLEIAEYCRDLCRCSESHENFNYFCKLISLLNEDLPGNLAAIRALYMIKWRLYDNIEYSGESELLRALHRLRLCSINNAIDLGCGTGRVGKLLRASGYIGELIGVDVSRDMIQCAEITQAYSRLIEDDFLTCLGHDTEHFDLATMIWTSAHCSPQILKDIIMNSAKFLKCGGTLLFDINHTDHLRRTEFILGTFTHDINSIAQTAKECRLIVRHKKVDDRVFFRLTKE